MVLKLAKLSRGPHLPTLVASSLSREIAQGRLPPGARLPTEQALAQTFGVSRNVIREAIARLRSEGRVWSQQGRGAFVSDTPNAAVLTIDHQGLVGADTFRGLFELRGILEVEASALAAERRTPKDVEALRTAQSAMMAAPYGSQAWLSADIDFHRAVAASTGNTYMLQFLAFVAERVRESILACGDQHRADDVAQTTLGEHEAVLRAIEACNAIEARDAMRVHLRGATERAGVSVTADTSASRPPAKRRGRRGASAEQTQSPGEWLRPQA